MSAGQKRGDPSYEKGERLLCLRRSPIDTLNKEEKEILIYSIGKRERTSSPAERGVNPLLRRIPGIVHQELDKREGGGIPLSLLVRKGNLWRPPRMVLPRKEKK